MSTRSNICIKRKDGTFEKIYCHSDGYLEYNGQILNNYYKDENKINNLMELGDISVLGFRVNPDSTIPHSFDYNERQEGVTVAYGRDRGEFDYQKKTFKNEKDFIESFKDTWCEYAYLYKEDNKEWLYSPIPYSKNKELDFHPLEPRLEEMGLIKPIDKKLDNVIRQEMQFLKDLDLYEYRDVYESDEDYYFETEELLSNEKGIKNYIDTNKECLNSIEDDLDDPNIRKIYDQGLKMNDLLRNYKKEFIKQQDDLEII